MIGAGTSTGARPGGRGQGIAGRRIVGMLACAVLAGIGLGAAWRLLVASPAHRIAPLTPRSNLDGEARWAAGARPAPPITALRDQNGHRFTLASLHGRTAAIVFFDSHCHQACPLAGRALAASERLVAPAQRPVLVVVSINPLDTPASTRTAVRNWGLAGLAPWHWLRGTHAELARVWGAYHISVKPMRGDIAHTEALYLLDRRGDERSGYLFPYVPGFVAHDLRVLAGARTGPADHA